jgi:hypothetical protein
MNGSPLAVRKLIVGILSLGSLTTAAGFLLFSAEGFSNPVTAVAMRLGLILGALWLALPSTGEGIGWAKVVPVAVVVAVACVRGGRFLLYAIPIAIVVGIVAAFIRPKTNRRQSTRRRER